MLRLFYNEINITGGFVKMKQSKIALTTALSGLIALGVATSMPAEAAKKEKCFGVAKAGGNDCQTVNNACAGQSNVDDQADAWLFVPKGVCEKLTGGSLEPKE